MRFFDQIVKNRHMFFVLSKILAVLLEPLIHPYLLLILAGLSKWRKRRHMVRLFLAGAVLVPLLYGFLPTSTVPLRFLENRFPAPTQQLSDIDGIIVLGGHTGSGIISSDRQQPQQGDAAERLTYGISLKKKHPDSILLFTGYSGHLNPKGWAEPRITRELLQLLDMPTQSVLFEDTSRNTYENAVNSRKVLVPQIGSKWILITSARHMPRAIGAFRAAGWQGLIPYPVDYATSNADQTWFSLSKGHHMMRMALHEIFGLGFYWITGRSPNLIAGPTSSE